MKLISMKRNLSSQGTIISNRTGKSGMKSARKLYEIDLADEQVLQVEVFNSLYNEWVFELRYGFGLLMYGFGSKKSLIEDFSATFLTDYSVIVVNGYFNQSILSRWSIERERCNIRFDC